MVRILWVKVGGLWPLNTGGRLRSFNTIAELAKHHQVVVLTTHEPHENVDELASQLSNCEEVRSYPYVAPKWRDPRYATSLLRSWFSRMPANVCKYQVPALQQQASRFLKSGNFDICVCDFIFAAPNVPFDSGVPVVFFAHNVEYQILKRLGSAIRMPLMKAVLAIEWRKMKRYEAEVCRRARLTIAVSPQDRDLFRASTPDIGPQIVAVPTGVDINYFNSSEIPESPRELVFSGSMDWHPNEDAVLFFITDILPEIRRQLPDTAFTVVGRNPSQRVRQQAAANAVKVTGTVEDVRPYIDAAAVYVVPLRVGGGTRLKVFEALSMGKAMVASSIAVEGLPLTDGKHYLRADEPDVFAAKVVRLLRDHDTRRALGQAGRTLARRKYAWPEVVNQFSTYCKRAME